MFQRAIESGWAPLAEAQPARSGRESGPLHIVGFDSRGVGSKSRDQRVRGHLVLRARGRASLELVFVSGAGLEMRKAGLLAMHTAPRSRRIVESPSADFS